MTKFAFLILNYKIPDDRWSENRIQIYGINAGKPFPTQTIERVEIIYLLNLLII